MTAMKTRLLGAALLLVATVRLAAAEPFFFVQIADPQFGMFTDNKDFAQETANLEFAVATINRLRPAFVVVSGDMLNRPGDAAQFREYQRIMSLVDRAIPVYPVAGNHDVGNAPTPASLAAYTNQFGPDYSSFRFGEFVGLVLNSVIIHTPSEAANQLVLQERWIEDQLKRARHDAAQHIVIFAHHPWFLESATEPDQYFNIPSERRARYLDRFREAGVRYLFSGHYHRHVVARDGGFEAIIAGPVGKPLGEGRSGLEVAIVRDAGIEHRFYPFGELPNRIDLGASPPAEGK